MFKSLRGGDCFLAFRVPACQSGRSPPVTDQHSPTTILCVEALGIPQADLDKVCREINTRSRTCLNGRMVADMFDEHID